MWWQCVGRPVRHGSRCALVLKDRSNAENAFFNSVPNPVFWPVLVCVMCACVLVCICVSVCVYVCESEYVSVCLFVSNVRA